MARADTSSAREMRRYWDGVGETWTEQHVDPVWRAHSDAVYRMLLDRWFPSAGCERVLKTDLFDEAVADGVYPALASRAQGVVGVDVAPRLAAAAAGRFRELHAVVADARQLPFDAGTFEVVVSLSTLDHFPRRDDIGRALGELHRVLVPGGTLLITLDNASNPLVAVRNALPHRMLHALGLIPYRMGATCTAGGFVKLLRESNFDVRDTAFIVHCPRLVAVVAGRLVARMRSGSARRTFLRLLSRCEALDRWPTRRITGYYTAVVARRR